MKLKSHLLIVTPLLLLPTLRAADQTWKNDGPTDNWSTLAGNENWDAGVVWTPGNNAIFGGTGENVTLTTGISVGNVTFNSGGYIIAGNTLTLSSSTINTGANDAAISSTLAGSTGLIKSGTGTLTVSTKPTYSGTTAINQGSLTYTFLGGAISNNHSGTGTWNLLPTGGAFGNFDFTSRNNNGFTGTLVYGAGAFGNIGANTQLPPAGSSIHVAAGGEILINNLCTYAGSMTLAGVGIVGGANPPGNLRAALHLYNATVSGLITLAGDARIGAGNAGPASTLSGGIDTAGYTVTFDNNNPNNSSGAINVTSAITGSGAVVVSNSTTNGFTLTLSGANTYAGNTTVSSGTMKLGANEAIPNGAGKGALTVNSTLNMNGKTETINGLSGTGAVNGTGALTVGDNNATSTFGGVISSALSLAKTGDGTLTLSGTNTYSGSTSVNAGTLAVTNSSGTGTGAVNVNDGGTLSPGGDSIGTVNIPNTLTLHAGGKTVCQINKTLADPTPLTQDLLFVNAVNYGGTLEVTASGDDLEVGDSFRLFDSIAYSGSFATFTLPVLSTGLSWDVSSLSVDGSITIVNTLGSPVFNLPSGSYTGSQAISITSNTGSTIYYTVDGTDPHTSGTRISGLSPVTNITLTAPSTTTIRAYAEMSGFANSAETSASYTLYPGATWITDGDGYWQDAFNWQNDAIGNGSGVTADFSTLDLTADTTVTLEAFRTIGKLLFADTTPDSNWILDGSGAAVLTLDAAVPTIEVVNQAATITAVLGGTNGLTKTGAGILALGGNNIYSGGTTINQGTLIAKHVNALGANGTVIGSSASNASLLLDLPPSGNFSRPVMVPAAGSGTATFGWIPGAANTGANHPIISSAITLDGRNLTIQPGAINDHGNRLDYTGVISGTGNITIGGVAAKLIFSGGSANTWIGNLAVDSGSALQLSDGSATSNNFIPDSAPVTVNGILTNAKNGNNETVGALAGSGTLNGYTTGVANTWTLGNGDGSATFSGVIENGTGTMNIVKTGSGTQTFSGANTYSGNTTVNAGTLALATGGSLRFTPTTNGVSNKITGAGTATLDGIFNINLAGANTTNGNAWTLVDVANKTYGATFDIPGFTQTADVWKMTSGGKTWTFTEATGVLAVGPGNNYANWATTNAPGQTMDMDHDLDGVPNGIEYFMGASGNVFTSLPAPDGTRTITWSMGASYTGVYGTDYVVQVSDDLGTWTPVVLANVTIVPGTSVSYMLPAGTTKFARLVVTGP